MDSSTEPIYYEKFSVTGYFSGRNGTLNLVVRNKETTESSTTSFTIGSLIDKDKRFRAFESTHEIFHEIKFAFQKKLYDLSQEKDNLVLSFVIIGNKTKITLPIKEEENAPEMEKEQEKQIEKLIKELDELKKLNSQLKKENDEFRNSSTPHEIKEIIHLSKEEISSERAIADLNSPLKISNLTIKSTINEHTDMVYSICFLPEGRFASCSLDKSIKIFNLIDFKCELTLLGHTNGVNYVSVLNFLDNNLISCSSDDTFKIWEINQNSYNCIKTMNENDIINKVIPLSNDRVCTCSESPKIKIYKVTRAKPGVNVELIKSLDEHVESVSSVIELKSRNILVSGSSDKTLRFWNLNSYQCEKIFENIPCLGSNSLAECGAYIVVGGGWGKCSVINTESFKVSKVIQFEEEMFINSVLGLGNGSILCGCYGQLIQIDIIKGSILDSINDAHNDKINGVAIQGQRLISWSEDASIKVWEFVDKNL